jgi:hypothetical protein
VAESVRELLDDDVDQLGRLLRGDAVRPREQAGPAHAVEVVRVRQPHARGVQRRPLLGRDRQVHDGRPGAAIAKSISATTRPSRKTTFSG